MVLSSGKRRAVSVQDVQAGSMSKRTSCQASVLKPFVVSAFFACPHPTCKNFLIGRYPRAAEIKAQKQTMGPSDSSTLVSNGRPAVPFGRLIASPGPACYGEPIWVAARGLMIGAAVRPRA